MKKMFLFALAAIVAVCSSVQGAFALTYPEGLPVVDGSTYYMLYSYRAGEVMKNNGADGIASTSATPDPTNDSLMWKFVQVSGDTFKIVSKLDGKELVYLTHRYVGVGNGTHNYNSANKEYVAGSGGSYAAMGTSTNGAAFAEVGNLTVRLAGDVEASAGGMEPLGSNRFVFKQFQQNDGFQFQLYVVGNTNSYINKYNKTDGAGFCTYSVNNDAGNSMAAVETMDDFGKFYTNGGAPALSTNDNPHYYQIQFVRGSLAVTVSDIESDKDVLLQKALVDVSGDEKDAQLFFCVGDYTNGFKIIHKGDLKEWKATDIPYTNTTSGESKTKRLIALADPGQGSNFGFEPEYVSGKVVWLVKDKDVGTYLDENHDGNGVGDGNMAALGLSQTFVVGTYGSGDGRRITFIDEGYNSYVDAPAISTAAAPIWFYVRNMSSQKVLTHKGVDLNYYTQVPAAGVKQDSQLYRFQCVDPSLDADPDVVKKYKAGLYLISKVDGSALVYDTVAKAYQPSATLTGDTLMFVTTSSNTHGLSWSLMNKGTDFYLQGSTSAEDAVNQYNGGDVYKDFVNAQWDFIPVSYTLKLNVNKGSVIVSFPGLSMESEASDTTFLLCPDGQDIYLIAAETDDYRFVRWSTGVELAELEMPALTANAEVSATFLGLNASLQTLSAPAGRLSPEYNTTDTDYSLYLTAAEGAQTLQYVPLDKDAAVVYTPGTLTNGTRNDVITVTSEEGSTTKTYHIAQLIAASGATSSTNLTALTINGSIAAVAGTTYGTTTEYSAEVPYEVSTATIAVTLEDVNAVVTEGQDIFSAAQNLTLGSGNVFTFTVLAADYSANHTYVLTITRQQSTDVTLSNLQVRLSVTGSNLVEGFTPDNLSYLVTTPETQANVNITATATSVAAITINGITAISGSPATKALDAACNTFAIELTAPNGTTKQTYTLKVAKGEGACEEVVIPSAVLTTTLLPLAVYPNPATNELIVNNGQLNIGDKVEIYSVQGTHVGTYTTATINISQLPAGLYLVKVGNKIAKVVKK